SRVYRMTGVPYFRTCSQQNGFLWWDARPNNDPPGCPALQVGDVISADVGHDVSDRRDCTVVTLDPVGQHVLLQDMTGHMIGLDDPLTLAYTHSAATSRYASDA